MKHNKLYLQSESIHILKGSILYAEQTCYVSHDMIKSLPKHMHTICTNIRLD